VARGDREQIGGALAHLPQGSPLTGPALREQQRPSGVLPEAGREERRASELGVEQPLQLFGAREQELGGRRRIGVGEPDHEPVVGPHGLHVEPALLADLGHDRHRPGRVDLATQRREDADAPVSELVASALDDQGFVVGDGHRGRGLVLEVAHEVVGSLLVEIVQPHQPLDRRGAGHSAQVAHELPDALAELERPARRVSVPEGHLPGLARRGRDHHLVEGDVLDPPGRGPEHERLPHPRLEDHLFVELADAALARDGSEEKDPVQPAVGDGAAVDDGHAPGAFAGGHPVLDAVPRQPGLELREVVGEVAAREHVEHALEHRAGEPGEGRRAADDGVELLDVPGLYRGHRHNLLGQDVERVARVAGLLDLAFAHGGHDRGAGHEVGAILREHEAAAGHIHLVAGAPDALQPARHRGRGLYLDNEIDGPHVDAELERRGGDERADLPGLQPVLDLRALVPRERAVVGLDEDLARELVQRAGEPLRDPAAVHEEQRRAVGADVLEQARMDGAPDGAAHGPLGCGAARELHRLADARHVLDRHLDAQLQRLARAGVHHRHRSEPHGLLSGFVLRSLAAPRSLALALSSTQKLRDLLERTLRRRETNALERAPGEHLEALERQREVGAALRGDERVDLVEDDGVQRAQHLSGRGGEQEIERLGRRDEDVGGRALEAGPLSRGGVTGADREGRDVVRIAPPGRLAVDAHERRAEVALDVHGQRLERGDVEHAAPLALGGHGLEHQAVDAAQERRQGLPGARGGEQKRGLPFGNRGPGELLRARRRGEGRTEPGLHRGMEELEGVRHGVSL